MFNYEYCLLYGILCVNILIPASGSACWSSLHCRTYNLQLFLLNNGCYWRVSRRGKKSLKY